MKKFTVRRVVGVPPAAVAVAVSAAPDDTSQARVDGGRYQCRWSSGWDSDQARSWLRCARESRRRPPGFPSYATDCTRTTAVLAYSPGAVMAGNFRSDDGGCYILLNLARSPLLTRPDICKLALHEMGHLGGLQPSEDPKDVMYSPFESTPLPTPCQSPLH